jgi:hypothetical protein
MGTFYALPEETRGVPVKIVGRIGSKKFSARILS